MFMWDPENHTTWDVHLTVQQITRDFDQGVHDTLVVPITVVSNADINHCEAIYVGQQQHLVPHETWKELDQQGRVLRDVLQRIIFPARFEDATPPKYKVICGMMGSTKQSPMLHLKGMSIPESK